MSVTPTLGRYLAGAVLVRLADEGARVALVLLALHRTGSAAIGGGLVAALLIPHVIAAPTVGLLTDRARRPQRIMGGAALGFAAALGCTATVLGRTPLPVVFAVLVAGGCCGPALTGALTSQLPTIVPEGSVPRAFGLDSLTYNVSGIVGPAIAAVFSGLASPATATLVLAGSAACGAAVLLTLPIAARDSTAASRRKQPSALAGALAMLRDRTLGVVTASSSLGQLGMGALPVVAAVLAIRRHEPQISGWLMTALAVGGLIGSLCWTWRPMTAERAPLVVAISLVGSGVPLAVAGWASLPLTVVLFAVSGFFTGPFIGALFIARENHAPDDVRAQVFTLGAGLKTTAAAAGAALAGVVASAPTTTQLLLAAGCPLIAGAGGAVALRPRG